MNHTFLKLQRCPNCGYKIDCTSSISDPDAKPRPGDITLCLRCMEIFLFTEDLRIKRATKREVREILNGPRGELVMRAQSMARFITRRYG